ncbi:MAG TPA: DNA helicase RecG, partial [Candidatus Hydrogenedentes bacterium]|nr:DNA helicase RecG [Candidatus Hydrogenedentota bacterium]
MPTGPSLEDGVASLPGIGPGRAALLARLGIVTVRDLLLHFPRAYRDCRELTPLASVEPGERVSVVAEITSSRQVR